MKHLCIRHFAKRCSSWELVVAAGWQTPSKPYFWTASLVFWWDLSWNWLIGLTDTRPRDHPPRHMLSQRQPDMQRHKEKHNWLNWSCVEFWHFHGSIAHISHNHHNRRWCTSLELVHYFAYKTNFFGPFQSLWASLSRFYALFGVLFTCLKMWRCTKIYKYEVCMEAVFKYYLNGSSIAEWKQYWPSHFHGSNPSGRYYIGSCSTVVA